MVYYEYNRELFFKLYAYCEITEGHINSIVINTKEKEFIYVNSDILKIIEQSSKKRILEIIEINKIDEEIIVKIFTSLIERKYGFYTSEPDYFPQLVLDYFEGREITNVIIEVDHNLLEIFGEIISQLDDLDVEAIEIRVVCPILEDDFIEIMKVIYSSNIVSLDLYIPYTNEENSKCITKILIKHSNRLSAVTFYNADRFFLEIIDGIQIIYMPTYDSLNKHCGSINISEFNGNLKFISEAKHFNSCLNRKISIDVKGNIKNCPSMETIFGNVKNTHLREIISNKEFRFVWDISKDKILVCKDCEFRYICMDCRAYLDKPEDIQSKPLKCGYDPYKGEWDDWTLLEKNTNAIGYYGLIEIINSQQTK